MSTATNKPALRPVRLADLGWGLTRGHRATSCVTTPIGRVDFIESMGLGAALRNAQRELRANATHTADGR